MGPHAWPRVPVAVLWFNRGCSYRFWRFPSKLVDIHAGILGKTQVLVVISVGSFRATTVPTGFSGNYHCFQGSRWGFPWQPGEHPDNWKWLPLVPLGLRFFCVRPRECQRDPLGIPGFIPWVHVGHLRSRGMIYAIVPKYTVWPCIWYASLVGVMCLTQPMEYHRTPRERFKDFSMGPTAYHGTLWPSRNIPPERLNTSTVYRGVLWDAPRDPVGLTTGSYGTS